MIRRLDWIDGRMNLTTEPVPERGGTIAIVHNARIANSCAGTRQVILRW